jgi:hypothetical protein
VGATPCKFYLYLASGAALRRDRERCGSIAEFLRKSHVTCSVSETAKSLKARGRRARQCGRVNHCQARVPVLADDEIVVRRDAERLTRRPRSPSSSECWSATASGASSCPATTPDARGSFRNRWRHRRLSVLIRELGMDRGTPQRNSRSCMDGDELIKRRLLDSPCATMPIWCERRNRRREQRERSLERARIQG